MTFNPSILYVEDDLQNRMVMEILLHEEMGLQNVEIFEDSQDFEARVDALSFSPDIVLLDIHVDPMNGFQMLECLRNKPEYATKPIVAITASVMNEEVAQLKTAGFDGAIAKPVPIETFAQTLQHLLDGQKIWRIV